MGNIITPIVISLIVIFLMLIWFFGSWGGLNIDNEIVILILAVIAGGFIIGYILNKSRRKDEQ